MSPEINIFSADLYEQGALWGPVSCELTPQEVGRPEGTSGDP